MDLIALNSTCGTHISIVTALNNAEGDVPEWIELIPAGPDIEGLDGRRFRLEPQAVLDDFTKSSNTADLVIDYEHGQERRADEGLPAPAAGWISVLEVRDGAIWGKVKWTERATNYIKAREYRYVSPALYHTKEAPYHIIGLKSVGLVNQPNLSLKALNSQSSTQSKKESPLDLIALAAALGLSTDATPDQIMTAINTLKSEKAVALNRAENPDISKFVPAATYDAAVNRATKAEAELAEKTKADTEAEIETAIDKALEEGKIAPSDKDFYVSACRAEGGLEHFNKFIASKAPIVEPKATTKGTAETGTTVSLNRDQQDVAKAMGYTNAQMAEMIAKQEKEGA